MSRSKPILTFTILTLVIAAWCQERPKTHRPQLNYGLEGPIHTQLVVSRKLNQDPREKPVLRVRWAEGWLEFAPDGELVERGNVNEAGEITTRIREKHDPEGRAIESTLINADGIVSHHHLETTTLKDGTQETKAFIDDKLTSRIVNTYNAQTGEGETTNYDGQGSVVHHSITHNSPARQELEAYGGGGELIIHSVRRLDEKHALIESLRYDAEGKVVSDLSFKDGVLTSWWQDPKCGCTNIAAVGRGDQSSIFYRTTEQGRLLKEIQHHQGRPTNHEIDDEELYDENDHLLERIAYIYERDAHGNWTRRTASILDPKTNAMVPIQEHTRTLTYY